MRNAIRILVLVLIAAGAYAYFQIPSASDKELNDALAEISSATSDTPQAITKSPSVAAPPAHVVPAAPAQPKPTAPTSAPPPVSIPPPPAYKPWVPPDVIPAQPNWTWTTYDGTTYNNVVVTKIEVQTVSITHSLGVAHIPIAMLPRDIRKKLNYDPVAASQIPNQLLNNLVSSDGSDFSAPLESIQYYIFYYSAKWCPPCHLFTPQLVKWYDQFHPTHPNFQLVFISEDTSEADMYEYMKEMAVPWPAMRYSKLQHAPDFKGPGVERYAGKVIPFLTVVDVAGTVIAQTLEEGGMVDQSPVLDGLDRYTPIASPSPSPPASATAQAPAQVVGARAPDSPASPFQPWTPPAVIPAQPNWTWTTTDGTTYNNVVVTKLGPETVSFTHAMGVAHDVPLANLPPDIQKKLNYDPKAAAAARKEADRERAHPYYAFADLVNAQTVARQLGWPLAWMCTDLAALTFADPPPDSDEDLSQRAVSHLKSQAIIVLVNGNDDLAKVPPLILNQFFVLDDGPIPGGHHFYAPKIILSDADITKTYGRITHTQLIARGDAAFDEGLAAISTGLTTASPTKSPPGKVVAPASVATPSPSAPASVTPAPAAPTEVTPWAPPDVIPAQPNWTWTTMDGTTYQNVVITKIEPDTVSITHSLGVAHIPINLLPRDIQQRLNYHRP